MSRMCSLQPPSPPIHLFTFVPPSCLLPALLFYLVTFVCLFPFLPACLPVCVYLRPSCPPYLPACLAMCLLATSVLLPTHPPTYIHTPLSACLLHSLSSLSFSLPANLLFPLHLPACFPTYLSPWFPSSFLPFSLAVCLCLTNLPPSRLPSLPRHDQIHSDGGLA